MDIFSNRPLFTSCMIFLAWTVAGFFMSENLKLSIIFISVLTLIFLCILAVLRYHASKKKNIFLLMILCFLMTASSLGISYSFYDRNYAKYESLYGKEHTIQGIVAEVLYESNFASTYRVNIDGINGENDEHKAILECNYSAALQMGDRISARVVATEPDSKSNRYNERLTYMSDGIFVIYSSNDGSGLNVVSYLNDMGLESFFPKTNNELSSILTSNIGGDAGDLSSALLLGNKDLLSDSIVRDFRRVGASHILALSGMHMSLIMGLFMILLKLVIRDSTPIAIIMSFIALFYLALTGFSVSAARSVIMLLTVYLSTIISGLPDSHTSLSIAGVAIIILSPGAMLDAGFWMSFASTFGILTFVTPVNKFFGNSLSKIENKFKFACLKTIYSCISAILVSIAALLPLIIVMCIFIKEISVFSILSSVVLSIPTAIIIIMSLLLLPFAQVPTISDAIVHVIRESSEIMINYCSEFSDYENIVISLNYPFALTMAVILSIALFIACISKDINPFLSLTPFALCVAVFIGTIFIYENTNKDNLNVAYINVSSNSDMLILSNERQSVICDISNGSLSSYNYALDEINESRATEIKAIMITRYTNQHNSTMYDLFQRQKVREIWVPHPDDADDYEKLETLYKVANMNNVKVYMYESGERMNVFEHVYVEHVSTDIKRSSVPIDLLNIYTYSEHLTYISPAYNESELDEFAKYSFSKSQYVIFGNRGPRTKSPYGLGDDIKKIKTVTFSDEKRIEYFSKPKYSFIGFYSVPEGGKMEYYLPK